MAAWDEFFKACDPYVHRLAYQRRDGLIDPQDRVQDIWRAIIAHLVKFDPWRGPILSWLTTVARHTLVDQDRCSRRFHKLEAGLKDEALIPDPGSERSVEARQARERVAGALVKLRARVSETNYRIVLERWYEDRPFSEIAAALGLSAKQVRDRHQRTIAKLRILLLTEK